MKQNRNSIRITLYGCFILLLAAGCQDAPRAQPDETLALPTSPPPVAASPTESEITQPTQELDMTQSTPPPGMEGLIERAKEDLAQRLSISIDQIDLVEAKAVTWPDASLGCPQPGMAYAEILTPGYLILLMADNKNYEYHASRGTEVIYCENPTLPVPDTSEDI